MLDSFRPFAAKFVETTFEEYSRKHERGLTAPISQSKEHKKIDIRNLYPHKHSDDELEARGQSFAALKDRVHRQREKIRRTDLVHERLKASKLQEEIARAMELKAAKLRFEQQLRENADALPKRKIYHSQHRSLRPITTRTSVPARTADNFFSLTATKLDSSNSAIRPSRHIRTKSLQSSENLPIDLEPERVETPASKLTQHQNKLVSKVNVKSPAYRNMMEYELKKIKQDAEMSYETFIVSTKNKTKPKFKLYTHEDKLDKT